MTSAFKTWWGLNPRLAPGASLRLPSGRRTFASAESRVPKDQNASATSAASSELLAIIPDNPGVLMRRIAIRPQHSPNFARLHKEGYVSWAGPLFEKHVAEGTRPFKGSVIVVNERDRWSLFQQIESDVYVKNGIWNINKARVFPFRTVLCEQKCSS